MSDAGGQVPAQAYPVQPMENFAARQAQEVGIRTTELGNVAFRAGTALQDSINDAKTREEDTAFLATMHNLTRGPNGYLRTEGKQAEDYYTNVNDAIVRAGQESMDRLQNDTQKRMFAPVLARNMMAAQGAIEDHRDRQVKQYYINENKARAGQYVQKTIDSSDKRNMKDGDGKFVGPFYENLGVALADMRNAGRAMGFADDSAQMHELERAVHTQVAQGVSGRLMDDNDYQGALEYVTEQEKKGNLQTDAAEKLMSSIWANRKRQMVDELANSIKATGIPESRSAFGYLLPVEDSKQVVALDDGSKRVRIGTDPQTLSGAGRKNVTMLQMPQSGTIEGVQREEDGTYTVAMVTNDGTVLTFGNLPPQKLPEKGTEIGRGELFAHTGGDGTFIYGAVRGNKPVDPMNVNVYGEPDRSATERPKTLSEAIAATKSIDEPEQRKNVQIRLREMYAQDDAIEQKDYRDTYNGMSEFLANPNNTLAMIPPDKWAMLKESDRQQFMGAQLKADELSVVEELTRNPERGTEEYLYEHRNELTRDTYIRFLKESKRTYENKIEADQLNLVLLDNGQSKLVNPKSDADKVRSLRLREEVAKQIDIIQQKQKKPVDDEQRRQIIEDKVLDVATVDVNWGWDPTVPIATMSAEEVLSAYRDVGGKRVPMIDSRTRRELENSLVSQGLEPTPSLIVRAWKQTKQGTK
jgi:hypothetical protein